MGNLYIKDGQFGQYIIRTATGIIINPSDQDYLDNGYTLYSPDESSDAEYHASSYSLLVESYIRERYTVDEEISMIRQEGEKTEEFQEYYDYCEECKTRAKRALRMLDEGSDSSSDADGSSDSIGDQIPFDFLLNECEISTGESSDGPETIEIVDDVSSSDAAPKLPTLTPYQQWMMEYIANSAIIVEGEPTEYSSSDAELYDGSDNYQDDAEIAAGGE